MGGDARFGQDLLVVEDAQGLCGKGHTVGVLVRWFATHGSDHHGFAERCQVRYVVLVHRYQVVGVGQRGQCAVGTRVDDVGAAAGCQRGRQYRRVFGVLVRGELDVHAADGLVVFGDLLVEGLVFDAPTPHAEFDGHAGRTGQDERGQCQGT